MTGERKTDYFSDQKILTADCNLDSDLGEIIVIACDKGKVIVLDSDDLSVLYTLDISQYFTEKMPKVTSICAALEREVILGYSNGFVLSVHIKEGKQKHQLIAATLFEHLDVPPAVQHIKTSIIDKLVFISYVNYSEG